MGVELVRYLSIPLSYRHEGPLPLRTCLQIGHPGECVEKPPRRIRHYRPDRRAITQNGPNYHLVYYKFVFRT